MGSCRLAKQHSDTWQTFWSRRQGRACVTRGGVESRGRSCTQRQSESFKIHISRRQSTDRCLCKWSADGFISSLALKGGELHRLPQLGRIIIENRLLFDVGNIWNISHNGIIGRKAVTHFQCGDSHVFTAIRQIIIEMWKRKNSQTWFYNQTEI